MPIDLTAADNIDADNIFPSDTSAGLMKLINIAGARASAKGGYYNRFQTALSRLDWNNQTPLNGNILQSGLTFITRPKLNLSQTSIRGDDVLQMLDTPAVNSFPFAIRCYLDPVFASLPAIQGSVQTCPFFNSDSPFILPLSNQITHINGFPNFELRNAQSADGFFAENQTTPLGSDFGNQSYPITATFQDIPGGFIAGLFYYWIRWIALMRKGVVMRYMDDIYQKRLSFTCSIYRLMLDPTKSYIPMWCKLTGCYPYMISLGDSFDISDRTQSVRAPNEYQIQFMANHVEYMRPSTLEDFNILMRRFHPGVLSSDNIFLPPTPENNFLGSPYIAAYDGSNRLLRVASPLEIPTPMQGLAQSISAMADTYVPHWENQYSPIELSSGLVSI